MPGPEFSLLDANQRPNRNLGEQFPRGVARQPNAAVRRGIIRDVAFVHSEIEAAQTHEIRHIDVINGRTVISLFVRDHECAALGAVARATSRASWIEYRHA